MNELEQVIVGDSAAAPPAHILEGVESDLAYRALDGAPHTIYQELWHITFWQQITLDWVNEIETPFPVRPSDGFPNEEDARLEPWDQLCQRFFRGNQQAAAVAADEERLERSVRCPSRPGSPRPHHVRPRATGEPGGSQCLSFWAHRPAAPALSSVAAALRRLYLVMPAIVPRAIQTTHSYN